MKLGYTEYDADGNVYTYADDGSDMLQYVTDANGYIYPSQDLIDQQNAKTSVNAPTVTTSSGTAMRLPAGATQTDYVKMISDSLPKVLQLWNAQQIAQVNIDRATRGLAPLNPAAYGPQVGVGLSAGTSQMLLYAAIGLGAFMILQKKRGGTL